MDNRKLGFSNIDVSRLCYGTLSFSKSQANLSVHDASDLLLYAQERGINFVDTAELYETYAHVGLAVKKSKSPFVVSTKSYAYDKESAAKSVEKARKEMNLDVIDIFMLHEQENTMTMLGHMQALEYYLEMKSKGIIRAVGLSTHAIEPVRSIIQAKSSLYKEVMPGWKNNWSEFDPTFYSDIDVIFPIINVSGIGLLDGTASDMIEAVEIAHSLGIGVLGMKILGGGNLLRNFKEAFDYALSIDCVDSFAIGMQSREEIDVNIALFENREIDSETLNKTMQKKRNLLIEDYCCGCGECIKLCGAKALSIIDGKATVNKERCVLCSYCARACKDFAIKVV